MTTFLRSKHLASRYFNADSPGYSMSSIPRYRFMYYATFVANSDAVAMFPNMARLGNWDSPSGISFMIRSIDKPKVDLTVQELNQYNRKRYVYTKLKYNPIQVHIYDTVDDRALDIWRSYFMYYFGDSRTKNQATYNDSIVGEFNDDSGWGLRPVSEQINFFSRLELYAIYGGLYTQINYINPRIVSIDWQSYENDTPGSAELTMSLDYEAIEYVSSGKIISEEQKDQFGFRIDRTVEPPGVTLLDLVDRALLIGKIFNNSLNHPINFLGDQIGIAPYLGMIPGTSKSLFGSGSSFNYVTNSVASLSLAGALSGISPSRNSSLGNFGIPNFGMVPTENTAIFSPIVNGAVSGALIGEMVGGGAGANTGAAIGAGIGFLSSVGGNNYSPTITPILNDTLSAENYNTPIASGITGQQTVNMSLTDTSMLLPANNSDPFLSDSELI